MLLREMRRSAPLTSHPASHAGRILCAIFASLWFATAGLAAPADPVEAMAKVVRDLDLQTKLPTDEPPKQPEVHTSDARLHIPGAEGILYAALAIGLVFVLFALRDTIPGISRRTRAKPSREAKILQVEAAVERMAETGDDADAMAKSGRLAEAMHMLLLRSLTELRRRLDVTIADSLTSREILTRLALPESGRHALTDLIGRVELVHFGNEVPAEADYGACRASYEALIGTMRAPGLAGAAAA